MTARAGRKSAGAAETTRRRSAVGSELGIGFLDPDLHYVQANAALAAAFGVSSMLGLRPSDLGESVHTEGRLRQVLRTGRPVMLGAGTKRMSYHQVLDGAGLPLGISAVCVGESANALRIARLKLEAGTDGLTGLVNHRVFQERLRVEVVRAQRHGRPLSLAMIDIDEFKQLNDTYGHQVGDDVLEGVAAHLAAAGRTSDTVARIGGDEFAMLLPETDADAALVVAERVHGRIRRDASNPNGGITISVGVCDMQHVVSADDLFRFADGALFWSKTNGRDAICRYSPELVEDLSIEQRGERLLRNRALAGIRSLARAIDAKDHSTLLHSERVASLSARLAEALDWDADRVAALREVALIHDAGKIGVPMEVLLKAAKLTPSEFDVVKTHAILGTQIASEVVNAEQVSWLRGHHENYDGSGYPDGLKGGEIPDGAMLLRLADSWDVMTSERAYSPAMNPTDAISECQKCAGTMFSPAVVAVLTRPGFERTLRIFANEQATRDANEVRLATASGTTFTLNCECGRDDCRATVAIVATDYRAIRLAERRFIVHVGHEIPEIETTLLTTPDYNIVEKA